MSKKILITGSSSGFGLLTAKTLLRAGHKVAATMRNVTSSNKEVADELSQLGAAVVEIDVTNDSSVDIGVRDALEKLKGMDVVINNAGYGVIGLQESFTSEDFRRLFEVNLFGVQRVNRAILPHFRERKDGLLVHVASILGRMALPYYGPYNASKWALEVLAENYRYELSNFGVDSVIVEPGGYPTSFMERLIEPSDNSRDKSYGKWKNAPKELFESFEKALEQNPEQNPQMVADAVLKVIDIPRGKRPLRTIVDRMGMGEAIEPYNEQLEKITDDIYHNFGIDNLRKIA